MGKTTRRVLLDWFEGNLWTVFHLARRWLDILRTVGSSVKEDWIVGGDFNAIINDSEKEGGHRKSRVTMDEFRDEMEELTLVDMKTDKDWFTCVNNRDGNNMPKEDFKDPRLFFKFDACWSKENEAKDIIKKAWSSNDTNIIEKLEKVCEELDSWQHGWYRRMKNRIRKLVARIDKLVDGPYEESNADMINNWSKRLLSYGGKEIFINSILQSLPTYALSVFLAPRGTLKEIQSKICQLWWACKEKGRG
ncbi:hypothetical protein GOBAR_DD05631 [Gossypium barbadense]|nr:hypothetical protein GOBAR_DD05631 [Gossypium barbadense]